MPERCAFWASERTLLVADVHLGKAETFRAWGLPLPAGVAVKLMDEKLGRLSRAIARANPDRVVILGDLLHAIVGTTDDVCSRFASWRESLPPPVRVCVVPGNHDRGLVPLAERWRVEVAPELWEIGPFAFSHAPLERPGKYTWCGHLHPAVHVGNRADALKLPCFHIGENVGVLPAFSAFTAGGCIERRAGDRIFALADERVIDVT